MTLQASATLFNLISLSDLHQVIFMNELLSQVVCGKICSILQMIVGFLPAHEANLAIFSFLYIRRFFR